MFTGDVQQGVLGFHGMVTIGMLSVYNTFYPEPWHTDNQAMRGVSTGWERQKRGKSNNPLAGQLWLVDIPLPTLLPLYGDKSR